MPVGLAEARDPIEAALEPRSGVLDSWWTAPQFNDEPKLWHLVGRLSHSNPALTEPSDENAETASGTSRNLFSARAKLAGEAVERFGLSTSSLEVRVASFHELTHQGLLALDPASLVLGEEANQIVRRDEVVQWEVGSRLSDGTRILVPSQLVGVPHVFGHDEAVWRAPVSTGGAAHLTVPAAVLAGLCEVIERDAFSIAWYRRLIVDNITDAVTVRQDPELAWFREADERYELTLEIYRVPTLLPVTIIMGVLWDNTDLGPPVVVAAKAHGDPITALRGAVEEAHQVRPWLRRVHDEWGNKPPPESPLDTLADRARRWFDAKTVAVLRDWLTAARPAELYASERNGNLQRLVDAVRDDGGTPVAVDLTPRLPKIVRRSGWRALKVIVPEYQPLNLTESCQDFAIARLEAAPDKLRTAAMVRTCDCDSVPHPFL